MADAIYTCQNLSKYDIVVNWSRWSVTLVARELRKQSVEIGAGDGDGGAAFDQQHMARYVRDVS